MSGKKNLCKYKCKNLTITKLCQCKVNLGLKKTKQNKTYICYFRNNFYLLAEFQLFKIVAARSSTLSSKGSFLSLMYCSISG